MTITISNRHKRLRTLLGDYPGTAAVKSGAVTSDQVSFDFVRYASVIDGFKPMIREQAFDVSELALVSYLIARDFHKPLVLLPATMTERLPHARALYNAERGQLLPADLVGKRVAIRSLTTTTGVWLRGILANDYAVDLDRIEWVTFEDPHVAECHETGKRAPEGRTIIQMLLDGEVDAVLGETCDDPRLKPIFADPRSAADAWFRRHKTVPINHIVVVTKSLLEEDLGTVQEIYRLLKRSNDVCPSRDQTPFGVSAMRPALEMAIQYAVQQNLISRKLDVDELFSELPSSLI
jgi:4,5-dihydroxyphthalate decarboxylase